MKVTRQTAYVLLITEDEAEVLDSLLVGVQLTNQGARWTPRQVEVDMARDLLALLRESTVGD